MHRGLRAWTLSSSLTRRTFPSSMPSISASILSRELRDAKEEMSFSLYSWAIVDRLDRYRFDWIELNGDEWALDIEWIEE